MPERAVRRRLRSAIVMAAVAAVFYFTRGRNTALLVAAIGAVFLLSEWALSSWWPQLAARIGAAFTSAVSFLGALLLALLYFLVITPTSVIYRLFVADVLRNDNGHWLPGPSVRQFDRQFSSSPPQRESTPLVRVLRLGMAVLALIALLAALDVGAGLIARQVMRAARPNTGNEYELNPLTAQAFDPFTYFAERDYRSESVNVAGGVRASYVPAVSSDGLDVYVYGGSAAWGFGARDAHTLPSEIARVAERHGHAWRVTNHAQRGFVNFQELVKLVEATAAGEVPQLLIFYDGFNDVYAALFAPDVERPILDDAFHRARMEQLFTTGRVLAWEQLGRAYQHHSLAFGLARRAGLRPKQRVERWWSDSTQVDRLANAVADRYLAQAEIVRSLGARYGMGVLLAWQPALATKPHLSAQEKVASVNEGASGSAVAQAYRIATRRVRAAGGVVDLSTVFDTTSATVFTDGAHVVESANARIAEALWPHALRASRQARPRTGAH